MEAALKLNQWQVVPPTPKYTLKESLEYALSARGSGMRYLLACEVGQAQGLPEDEASRLAEAVEWFHHASLLLDDLPCMDDALERRGEPCLHRVAGEEQAILAALALINRAYLACWQVAALHPERASAAATLVMATMGECGILEGQSRDLGFAVERGAAEVRTIATLKTGMLLQMALVLPALLGGADRRTLLRLARLARTWGRLYQAIDDFGDVLLSGAGTGKTPFRDLRKHRPNLVVALGPEAACAELEVLETRSARICEQLLQREPRWAFLMEFHAQFGEKTVRIRGALEAS